MKLLRFNEEPLEVSSFDRIIPINDSILSVIINDKSYYGYMLSL